MPEGEGPGASGSRAPTLAALVERIFPESSWGPGARQLGLAELVWELASSPAGRGQDWQWKATPLDALEHGLDVVQKWSLGTHEMAFADLPSAEQVYAVSALEGGSLPGFQLVSATAFFDLLYGYVFDALFVVPTSGGYSLDAVWDGLGLRPHPAPGAAAGESGP
jgi:hypothetical protein